MAPGSRHAVAGRRRGRCPGPWRRCGLKGRLGGGWRCPEDAAAVPWGWGVLPAPLCARESTASLTLSYAPRGERCKAAAVKAILSDEGSAPLPSSRRELEQVWANSVKTRWFGFVLAGHQLAMIVLCVYNYLLRAHIISQEQAAAMGRIISYPGRKKESEVSG